MPHEFDAYKAGYAELWDTLTIRPSRTAVVQAAATKILANKSRYDAVASATGVPWYVIAIIHNLEASLSFSKHLHNGDPLTARTVQVPAGRPLGEPPFTWEESARDAIGMKNLSRIGNWTVERLAHVFEGFNGWGYRSRDVNSPYLWSFSTHYSKGKFVADGKYSDTSVSQQIGAMVLLKALEQSGSVGVFREGGAQPPGNGPAPVAAGDGPRFTRTISRNDPDERLVRMVQEALNEAGAGPLQIDGHFGEATENAVKLFQARAAEPDGTPLIVDGIVGPRTFAALMNLPEGMTIEIAAPDSALLARVVQIARAEVGVMEDPPGSNRGPRVDEYIRSVGLNPANGSYAWCTCFIYWIFDQASRELGRANPLAKTASVHSMWNNTSGPSIRKISPSDARKNPELVKPGHLFFLDSGGGKGHAGIVVGNVNGVLETVEGNSNTDGSREGKGVYHRRSRRITAIDLGFIEAT